MAWQGSLSLEEVQSNQIAEATPVPTFFDATQYAPAVNEVPERKPLFDFRSDKPAMPVEDSAYLQALAKHAEESEKNKADEVTETINKIEKLSNAALIRLLNNPATSDSALVQAARVGLERVDKDKYNKAFDERLKKIEAATEANAVPDSELPPNLRKRR